MTFEEAMAQLKVSRSTVQRLVRAGEIRSVNINRAVRLDAASIADYMRRQLAASKAS